ncbi:MAG: hypothetical protein OXF11_11405 [Deltaproteobacteria bacterium]|nr:hypothetical protein [Deltaproteobacteria bacterium]
MEDATILESRLADVTAEEYRSKGYAVSRDESLDFLPGFRADLVARKGDETKVIEVKCRSTLTATPEVTKLAQLLNSKPGWSFELILVGEPEGLESPDGAKSFEGENILQRIAQAERVLESGFAEAAFLLAWSACEALLRMMIEEEGVSIKRITTSGYVLNLAVVHGVISRDDYQGLADMMKCRNAIAHGFGINKFGDEQVTVLIETTKRLARMPSQ